ncbi:MAG: aminopeptidase P N-terminal domain-containing protein [Bdellovibrionota bacterium]
MLLSHVSPYFKERRSALMKANPGSVFIFPSNEEVIRNGDVSYPFRQESNFYYLSGFTEPDAFLVLAPSSVGGADFKMVLFVRPREPEKELWEGELYGIERACGVFGADEAYPVSEFEKRLPEIFRCCERVYYRLGQNEKNDRRLLSAMEAYRRSMGRTGKSLLSIGDPTGILGEMRLFKTSDEIEQLRRACKITALAHKKVMQAIKADMNESEVEALIDYYFRKGGCKRLGFATIVACGKSAACLHYRNNNEQLKDGELVLIDAGGEFDYYSADVTRTFPVGKKFTKAQADLYELVLLSQKEAIASVKPGVSLPDIHKQVCEVLVDGLLGLGLLTGNLDDIIKNNGHLRFYPHKTSHWLGIDVHDAGLYIQGTGARVLEEGMVFTIEPGLYIQPTDTSVPAHFRNIGIRIEDDILVTKTGCEVMTSDAPKEVQEIEALR